MKEKFVHYIFILLICLSAIGCGDKQMAWQDGYYRGQTLNQLPNGYGEASNGSYHYEGEWVKGLFDGWGKLRKKDFCYEGHFSEGKYDGQGCLKTEGNCYEGSWKNGIKEGKGTLLDSTGRCYTGIWHADSLVSGVREDSSGVYQGNFNADLRPSGYGSFDYSVSAQRYEGDWEKGVYEGFGIRFGRNSPVQCGWWKNGTYLGEKMKYNSSRVYGIDISRYQHKQITIKKGKRKIRVAASIDWKNLRIKHLGARHNKNAEDEIDYPVSFCYIKSTQGTRIRSAYYAQDAKGARSAGIKVGAYHFMSPSAGIPQAKWFLRNTRLASSDLPPVLDVELTPRQINKMGGKSALYKEILAWLRTVNNATGKKPILYVSQTFIDRYLQNAPQELLSHDVWIARYGEYRPYVRLLYWQLSPFGRVEGIHGEVDIDVFNGSREQFEYYTENNFKMN